MSERKEKGERKMIRRDPNPSNGCAGGLSESWLAQPTRTRGKSSEAEREGRMKGEVYAATGDDHKNTGRKMERQGGENATHTSKNSNKQRYFATEIGKFCPHHRRPTCSFKAGKPLAIEKRVDKRPSWIIRLQHISQPKGEEPM